METDYGFTPLDGESLRQYVNAREAFAATRAAEREARDLEGNMFWRVQNGREYLIRVSRRGAQTSLGPRSPETEVIRANFQGRKATVTERLEGLHKKMAVHAKLNRVRYLDRVDSTVIDILNSLHNAGLDENMLVIDTNALFCYEATAGIRIEQEHLATEDRDILWDNRKRITLATREKLQPSGLLGILKTADKSFELKSPTELYTAVNKDGYQVDLLLREGSGSDREPDLLSTHDKDFWAVKARNVDWLLSAPKFQSAIVGVNGTMAQMTTVDPRAFALFKMWMSVQKDRDPVKKCRDANQARVVIKLIHQYLPHLTFDELVPFSADLRAAVSSFAP
jgi:hypothetical protein